MSQNLELTPPNFEDIQIRHSEELLTFRESDWSNQRQCFLGCKSWHPGFKAQLEHLRAEHPEPPYNPDFQVRDVEFSFFNEDEEGGWFEPIPWKRVKKILRKRQFWFGERQVEDDNILPLAALSQGLAGGEYDG